MQIGGTVCIWFMIMLWVLHPESKVFLNISSVLSRTWREVSQGEGPAFSSGT